MKAYHYSSKKIPVGSTIKSDQSSAKTYNRFWAQYNIVAKELKISFPDFFGYAYENLNGKKFKYVYEVECTNYIRADFRYSIFVVMSNGLPRFQSSSLEEKISFQDQWIREQAFKYFLCNSKNAESNIELISADFVVIKVVE